MTTKLLLGPILGLESGAHYTVTFITHCSVAEITLHYLNKTIPATKIGEINAGTVWRAKMPVSTSLSHTETYSLTASNNPVTDMKNKDSWEFYVPSKEEKPKLAYASCNGFSDYKLLSTTDEPYYLWHKMAEQHAESPFSLLLMGGDQVYADSIWTTVPTLKSWNEGNQKKKVAYNPSQRMLDQIDKFYSDLYVDRWNKAPMAQLLSSIPSLMMWDDHDITDGWGSFPEAIQQCDVFKAIFASAKKHFALLQIRGEDNSSRLNNTDHFSSYVRFRNFNILLLDNRTERSISEVMSPSNWSDVINCLENQCNTDDLLLLSAVPVVYRDFSFAENALDITPWEEELTDDLKDHWRAKEHEGERLKLIMRLLDNANKRQAKTVILSGDVHIGGLGIIQDQREPKINSIHQVISSGIVHPAPTYIQWLGILAVTNDDREYLNESRTVTANMIKPHGSDKYIRCRNFVTLLEGTDCKLWVNWINEGKDKPAYPMQ